MSEGASQITERAAELRRDFDRAFAEPIKLATSAKEELLAIHVGRQACAMRLAEIAGLFAYKKVTRVPGSDAALLGIAGFRGAILPVYDLRKLLGHSDAGTPRWMVIAAAAPVALAFETFDGQLRVSPEDVVPQAARSIASNYARGLVRAENFAGPILHLPSVLAAIKTPTI